MEEEGLNQMLGFDEQIKNYSKRVFSQAEMTEKMKNLNRIVAEIYPQTTIVIAQLNDHTQQLMLPLEIHGSLGIFQLEMKVDFQKNDINLKAYLADNMGRIQIQQKLLRLQVCRYMLRLNSNMRVGSFFQNPAFGFLGFNLQCEGLKKKLLFQTEIDEIEFGGYIKGLILTAVNSYRFHFLRILILTNKIKIKDLELYSNYMEARYSKEQNWRKLPNQSSELLDRIKDVASKNMHLPFTKDEYDVYGPILSKQILNDQRVIQEIKPTQANDLNVEKHHKISEGGFCDIFAKDIFYTPVKEGNPQQVKRPLVIKQARDKIPDHIQRIIKESQILQTLAHRFDFQKEDKNIGKKYFKPTGCCPYIAQFYFVQTNPEILLMERYYHQSLDYYKVKMQEVMSLSTRLFIAHNIAMALRYCHYYGVVHMDIKPGNVLIAKNMMAKLTDFGEAHQIFDPISNQYYDQKNIKSGRTFPYCAPEITKQDSVITTAYDIYCFGVLLFELIFDRFPIDYRKANQKVFEDRLSKLTYQVRYNEEYDKTLGPQKMMKYLGRMCLQCLQPNPAHRPHIDKIVLVIKDCLTYLDKVY